MYYIYDSMIGKYNGNVHITSICPVKPISVHRDRLHWNVVEPLVISVIRVINGSTEHCRGEIEGVGGLGCG